MAEASTTIFSESAAAVAPAHSPLIRGDGRPGDVVAFESAVVSFFVDAAELLGVPKSVAAIYGLCFASPEPLSFSRINERLEISSGSISQGLRILREVGALRVAEGGRQMSDVGQDGKRREYYAPDMELRKLAMHFIENRLEKQLKAGKTRLQAIRSKVPNGDPGALKVLNARLKYLQSWQSKAQGLVPLAKTFLKV